MIGTFHLLISLMVRMRNITDLLQKLQTMIKWNKIANRGITNELLSSPK